MRRANSNAKLLFDKYTDLLLYERSHTVTSVTLKRSKKESDNKNLEPYTVTNFVRLCNIDRELKGLSYRYNIFIFVN